jgi:hypothetical protein
MVVVIVRDGGDRPGEFELGLARIEGGVWGGRLKTFGKHASFCGELASDCGKKDGTSGLHPLRSR